MTGLVDTDISMLRLRNQRLWATDFSRPEQAVAHLVAVQAQDYSAAKWALGQRVKAAVDDDVEAAFAQGKILRTHLLRPTWHFVTPADVRWLLTLTAPRVEAVNAGMYRRLGLSEDLLRRANRELEKALTGGRQLTRDELRGVLKAADFGMEANLQMNYFLMNAELSGILVSGPRRGKQITYALLEERAPLARTLGREEALATLANNYFASRGPATARDFAKWSGLTLADARLGLEAVKGQLESAAVDGQEYWFSPYVGFGMEGGKRAYLLSIYDEYVSSYKDHSPIADAEARRQMRGLGNALTHIIVFDGKIAGAWRRELHRGLVVIEARYFVALTDDILQAVEDAARGFGDFLGMRVEIVTLR